VVSSIFYFLSSFSSPNFSGRGDWMSTILPHMPWCGLSANLECRSKTCCRRLAGNTERKKSPKIRHLGTIAKLCPVISSQLKHVSTTGKMSLNRNNNHTCPHNMANFGPPAAEICWRVWGTPENYNGFCVLAVLLHGTLVVGVSQTLRR